MNSIASYLVALSQRSVQLFHDEVGDPWCWDGRDALRIGTGDFEERVAADYFKITGRIAPKASISNAVNTLKGLAKFDSPEILVGLRIAGFEDAVVIDLADGERRVVIIDAEGWSIATESPVRFYRPKGMGALLAPVRGGNLAGLEDLLPLDPDSFVLAVAWLLGCLNPGGAKPLLDLSGSQGSGKSMCARMLRDLVDPNATALQTMPTDLRNLAVIVSHHAVPVFDNLSGLNYEMSDGLCRIATGSGFEVRKNYTDLDLVSLRLRRPMILTGIPDLAQQPDLADRMITVRPGIDPAARRSEAEVLAAFEELRPGVLGVLFDAASMAMRDLPTTVLPDAPRMQDFAQWVRAGSPAFGWEPGRFTDAYAHNRHEASSTVVESSFLSPFLTTLATQGFTGTATECLARLVEIAGDGARHRRWPQNAQSLGTMLRRLAPSLVDAGVFVTFDRGGARLVHIHDSAEPVTTEATVLPFTKPASGSRVAEVAAALHAAGVDLTWERSKLARLALTKATGNAGVAAEALNDLGIPGPADGTWTPDAVRGAM